MKQISIDQLQANQFYWAVRNPTHGTAVSEPVDIEIIQVSTVFGASREFWTVATMGSDRHFDLESFEYIHRIPSPPVAVPPHSNLTVISSNSHTLGH